MPAMIPLLVAALAAGPIFASTPSARGVVVCDDVRDPLTLDPQKEFSEKNHTLVQQIYEGLVRFDADGKIEPALAVSWERVDPLKMRFHLREGVKFHNGEPFNAEAVRFSIARYLDPKTGFPAVGFLSSLDRADAVDDRTVDIVTKFPDGLLLNRLAGFVLIVPPAYLKEKGDDTLRENPVGTGPFVFDSWEKGKRIILRANAEYWLKGYPRVRSLEFAFVPWDLQVKELLSGQLDIVTELPGTQTAAVTESRMAKVIKRETFYTMTAPLNVSRGPLSDLRVRQALNYAVNKDDLIRFDLLGNGRELATLTMSGEEGHDESLLPYPYDPNRARSLLAEAGYKGGLTLSALVKEQGLRTAKIIRTQLGLVGVRLKIKTTTDSEIVHDIASRSWDLVFGGCPDPMVHTYFIPTIILYSKSPYSVGHDAELDRMLEDMSTTLDQAEREKKAKAIDRRIHDEALSIFTYQRIKTYGVSNRVKFTPWVTGMPYFYGLEEDGENKKAETVMGADAR
jgi:peptide/nickel transport system substrate-binding protein